jgi:hypothetical protein
MVSYGTGTQQKTVFWPLIIHPSILRGALVGAGSMWLYLFILEFIPGYPHCIFIALKSFHRRIWIWGFIVTYLSIRLYTPMYLIFIVVLFIKPTLLPLYVVTYNLRVPFAYLLILLNCRMVKFEAPNIIRIRAHMKWGQVGTQFWTTQLEAWASKTI